jgi:hypothetical protein
MTYVLSHRRSQSACVVYLLFLHVNLFRGQLLLEPLARGQSEIRTWIEIACHVACLDKVLVYSETRIVETFRRRALLVDHLGLDDFFLYDGISFVLLR